MMMMTIIKNEGGFFVAAADAECKCTLITMKVVMIIITFMNIIYLSNLSTLCPSPIYPTPKAHVEDYEMKKKILVSEK